MLSFLRESVQPCLLFLVFPDVLLYFCPWLPLIWDSLCSVSEERVSCVAVHAWGIFLSEICKGGIKSFSMKQTYYTSSSEESHVCSVSLPFLSLSEAGRPFRNAVSTESFQQAAGSVGVWPTFSCHCKLMGRVNIRYGKGMAGVSQSGSNLSKAASGWVQG